MEDRLAWLRSATTPPRRSIVELIAADVLDAELAALAWILIEERLPVIVAGLAQGGGKTTLLEALLDFLPSTVRRVDLAGVEEDFDWLPEATELGWRPSGKPDAQPIPVTMIKIKSECLRRVSNQAGRSFPLTGRLSAEPTSYRNFVPRIMTTEPLQSAIAFPKNAPKCVFGSNNR